jgi:hypothetical protein
LEGGQAISNQAMAAQEESAPVEPSALEDRGCPSSLRDGVARRSLGEDGKPLLQGGSSDEQSAGTRRCFLGRSVRRLAYVSPVVLLLRPRPACASRIYS